MLTTKLTRQMPDLKTATNQDLLAWYNENSGHVKPLDRFRDRETAERRCRELNKACLEMSMPGGVKPLAKAHKKEIENKKKIEKEEKRIERVHPVIPAPMPAPGGHLPPPPPQPAPAKRYESKTPPDSKYHLRERSTAEKPVAIVHRLCADNPGKTRKEIIDLCIAQGVNKNTAATQYSLWKRANP